MSDFNPINIQKLLSDTGSVVKKYEMLSRETGSNFNIFEVADISTKETTICRVLTELLDPNGCHGQGLSYLEAFLNGYLGIFPSKDELGAARVYREYATDKGRKIDIVVEVGNRFIPIETKIYAEEGVAQCYDYFDFAKNKKGDKYAKVVYLTRFGYAPTEHSAKGLAEDSIENISFSHDILAWLEKCLSMPDTLRKAPIREILIQLMSAIKNFTNQLEDKPMSEIRELLLMSTDNLKNAMSIMGALESCKAERPDMIMKLFAAIEKKLANDHLQRASLVTQDYVTDYERVKKFRTPGINYIVGRVERENVDVLFRVEIGWDGELYCGFLIARNNELISDKAILSGNGVRALFNAFDENNMDDWYVNWDYIYFNDEIIDFKDYNENYYKLFNPDMFENIVESAVEQSETILGLLK